MSNKNFLTDLKEGITSVFRGPSDASNLLSLDGRPPFWKAFLFGLQHLLAMLVSNVTPIILVFASLGLTESEFATHAMMGAFLFAGLGTIVQLLLGARLPLVLGSSFAFMPALIVIGRQGGGGLEGLYTIYGSLLVGCSLGIVLALTYRFWGKLIKPVVPPIVILAIGLSLLSNAANQFLGGTVIISNVIATGKTGMGVPYFVYPLIAFVTLSVSLIWSFVFKGVWKNVNILMGIVVGVILAFCIPGVIDFSSFSFDSANLVGPNGIIDAPRFLDITAFRFLPIPCLMTSICALITTVECISSTSALSRGVFEKAPTQRQLIGANIALAGTSFLAVLFGAFPFTMYSENVGIVITSKSPNRFSVFLTGFLLVILSFFPILINCVFIIPEAVIGGTMAVLFGTISVIGFRQFASLGFTNKNTLILALSLTIGFGLSIATIPLPNGNQAASLSLFDALDLEWLNNIFSSPIINMFLISFILSWAIPEGKAKKD